MITIILIADGDSDGDGDGDGEDEDDNGDNDDDDEEEEAGTGLRMNWSCMRPPHPTQVLHQSPANRCISIIGIIMVLMLLIKLKILIISPKSHMNSINMKLNSLPMIQPTTK